MIYLATPYSHPDPAVRELRYEAVTRAAAKLVSAGLPVYSPITHNHPLTKHSTLPGTWDFWESFDRLHINNSSMLVVLKLPGWEESKGVTAEVAIAKTLQIKVAHVTPEELETVVEFYRLFLTAFNTLITTKTSDS